MDTNDSQAPQENEPSVGNGGKVALLVLIVIVLAGLIWYYMKQQANTKNQTKSATSQTQQQTGNQPTSLKELMAGGPQKCEVSFANGDSQSQGTVYVTNGKFRGDFSATVNGQTNTSHMINDSQTSYMWMEGQATGYKMAAMATSSMENSNSRQSVDQNAKYDYHCSSWSADNSQFTPPSGVNFMDMSAMMGASSSPSNMTGTKQNPGGDVKTEQCLACNNLSDSQKAQCRAALSCP